MDYCNKLLANTAWCFDVGPDRWTSFDEAISDLLTAIGAARPRVAPCARAMGLKVAVVCVVFLYEDRPAYFVTPATLQALTELEAELSFEIFDRRDLD